MAIYCRGCGCTRVHGEVIVGLTDISPPCGACDEKMLYAVV